MQRSLHNRPKIFLAHAREDVIWVKSLYRLLSALDLRPWMAPEDIPPGGRWDTVIRKSLSESDFVIACLSPVSVAKRGYVQREFRLALDLCQEMPGGESFLIPLRLHPCDIPAIDASGFSINELQWLDAFAECSLEQFLTALGIQGSQPSLALFQRVGQSCSVLEALTSFSSPIGPLTVLRPLPDSDYTLNPKDIIIPRVGELDLDPELKIGRCSVLEINDDVDVPEARTDFSDDIDFTFAPSAPEASKCLAKANFDYIIVDVNLGESSPRGDAWLVENLPQLKTTDVVILTGFRNQMKYETALRKHHIQIIEKASEAEQDFWRNLKRLPERKRRDQAKNVFRALHSSASTGAIRASADKLGAEDLYDYAMDTLLNWLRGRIDKNSLVIKYAGRNLSIGDLIKEICDNTELGRLYVRMFIDSQLEEILQQCRAVGESATKKT